MSTPYDVGVEWQPEIFPWDISNERPRLDESVDTEQYSALMHGVAHPHRVVRFYSQNGVVLFKPLSSNMDTPFHVAAYFGDTHLLRVLLRIAATYTEEEFKDISEMICNISNNHGNNILHQVAATGEVKVLELLTRRIKVQKRAFLEPEQIKELIVKRNFDGETPIFKASTLGGKKMLQCMIEKIDSDADLYSTRHLHLQNQQNQTILEMAILSQHFDSAIWLLKENYFDKNSFTEKDEDIKCLGLLATMPQAFKSGYTMGIWHGLIYIFVPVDIMEYAYQWHGANCLGGTNKQITASETETVGGARQVAELNARWAWLLMWNYLGILLWVYYALWLCIAKVMRPIERVWEKKRAHSEAVKLLKQVLEKGKSWKNTLSPAGGGGGNPNRSSNGDHLHDKTDRSKYSVTKDGFNPLLLAASNGIVEMVTAILHYHPIAIESSDDRGWNLLHVAAAFRQTGIFSLLNEEWELPVKRLASGTVPGYNNYTVLHQVSDTEMCLHPSQGMQFGPALQLQDELRWYEEVLKIAPNTILFSRDFNNYTAIDLFAQKHKDLHETAKAWLKDTSVSCSTVAVLIAGVAFAGACTVPGDYNEDGYPNLRGATLYKIFTASDMVALLSSLMSVVVFLSILTSPLPMRSFRHSLPRKFLFGFAVMFVSLAATMLAFMAAVLLVVGLKHKYWERSLVYATLVLPMPIFGIIQFPVVYAFEKLVKPAAAKLVKTTKFRAVSFIIRFHNLADKLARLYKSIKLGLCKFKKGLFKFTKRASDRNSSNVEDHFHV